MSGAGSAIADGSQTGTLSRASAPLDLVQRSRRGKPLVAIEDHVAELVHGQDRHGVRGGVGEADALLRVAHLVGEGPAAGHDHQRQAGPRQRGDPQVAAPPDRPCCRRA